MMPLLQIDSLNASYGQIRVIRGVSLSVETGSVTAILGANGAGKTTLLRSICNMMVRTTGDILFRGQKINKLPTQAIARLGIGHVPDGRGTFLHFSVADNLRLGSYARRDKQAVQSDLERMFLYFPRLRERYGQTAGTLSGGEQQMLAIARALMSRPALLLLDEPSFGLAPLIITEIFRILNDIKLNDQVSILLVEQNAKLALAFADYAYLLETGRVAMEGSGTELSQDKSIRDIYLGY
jgi:branched-chain amino acid transport system ATP-binding protein